ncbi:MAG: hypothetical protein ACMUHU_00765 [Thermoplasmatota archaeon]
MAEQIPDRSRTLRMVLKALNGTVKTLSSLKRDPPIVELAHLQMNGIFRINNLSEMEAELFALLSRINGYRSKYWSLEKAIMQSFLRYMKKKRYLPSFSPEIDSLKIALPEALILGDERIWVYSYDQYIVNISDKVGRRPELAPKGIEVYEEAMGSFSSDIQGIVNTANQLLPEILIFSSRVKAALRSSDRNWSEIRVKKPRVHLIERPIRKAVIVKRPLPLPKKPKRPRRKVLKGPKHHIIGPEGR